MDETQQAELKRQSDLLESLEGLEGFRIWRKEVVDVILDQLDKKLGQSDQMSEAVLRSNVLLRYLIQDTFYGIFERVRVTNQQERDNNR